MVKQSSHLLQVQEQKLHYMQANSLVWIIQSFLTENMLIFIPLLFKYIKAILWSGIFLFKTQISEDLRCLLDIWFIKQIIFIHKHTNMFIQH